MGSLAHTVLVVEDDPDIRDTLAELLAAEGYAVTSASNGREALDRLAVIERPCMILLDLMMPVMNGWDFLDVLGHADGLSTIPVTVVSAAGHNIPTGVARYLRKPIDLDRLIATVRSTCGSC
jgi:CheY-like chemotaxis protein